MPTISTPICPKHTSVEGKCTPFKWIQAICHMVFSEQHHLQPRTASSHFNLFIHSLQAKQKHGPVLSDERQMPLKSRDQFLLSQWSETAFSSLDQLEKVGVPPGSQRLPPGSPWEVKLHSAIALLSKWHLNGPVIYTDLYKIEGALWNLFLQLHFLRITRD